MKREPFYRNPEVDPEKREEYELALAWGQARAEDAVRIAQAMLTRGKHLYQNTVPAAVRARRRRRNKVAKASRKANRK